MTRRIGEEDERAIQLEIGIVSDAVIHECDTMLAITKRVIEASALAWADFGGRLLVGVVSSFVSA